MIGAVWRLPDDCVKLAPTPLHSNDLNVGPQIFKPIASTVNPIQQTKIETSNSKINQALDFTPSPFT
jgi:hypothetical protein